MPRLLVCVPASPRDAVGLVVADHSKPKNGETHVWLHGSRLALEAARITGTAAYLKAFGVDWSAGTALCTAIKPIETMAAGSDGESDDDESQGQDSDQGSSNPFTRVLTVVGAANLINARAELRKIYEGWVGRKANIVEVTPSFPCPCMHGLKVLIGC